MHVFYFGFARMFRLLTVLLLGVSLFCGLWAQETRFTSSGIGEPVVTGTSVAVEGGFDVTGGGEDIGGTSDQLHFLYESRTGDFDVRVRVESVAFVDVWTKAGLMVRESLNPGSAQACVLATPTISGILFQSRSASNAAASSSGNHRVNFPFTWLRLKREGELISGFASFDGLYWSLVDAATVALPESVLVGMAVSSHASESAAVARFREFGDVGPDARGAKYYDIEPPGPSSRRTGLAITEIMYHPWDRIDERDLEFVEIMNTDAVPHDIGGFRLDGDVSYTFPEGYRILPGTIVTVAKSPSDLLALHEAQGVLGGFVESLPNDAGTVRLKDRHGAVLLEVNYDSVSPWPAAADGAGHSLVLSRPSYGERSVKAWSTSAFVGGSPGAIDPVAFSDLHNVRINEFLANSVPPEVDFVELYNHSNDAIDLGGVVLTDDPLQGKYRFSQEAAIPANGFLALTEDQLGFALRSSGETLYLLAQDGSQVIDALRFDGQSEGIASGRHPDGAPGIHELAASTPGSSNSRLLFRDIVINEIMYHPHSGDGNDEYIELFNRGARPVDLSGWRLDDAVRFVFPEGTSIQPGNYLVVARSVAQLIQNYPQLDSSNTVGNYQGSLSNRSERITLRRPTEGMNPAGVVSSVFVMVDQVAYRDSRSWGRWADGGGSSLELRDPHSDNRFASNWADSDETAKADWTRVEHTGLLELGRGNINDIQIFLQGAGECLVDDVEFIDEEGTNRVTNGGFADDRNGWFFQGTHDGSFIEAEAGFESQESLHIVATGRGDNGANRVRFRMRPPFVQPFTMATIRAKVRWLRGHPEILIRPKGNYLEAIGKMEVPRNLGTPGLRNSQKIENAGPSILEVGHFPVLPRDGEAVRVTARVDDPQGVAAVELKYRIDPEEMIQVAPMADDGTSGDAVAGDGVYSARIAGQTAGTVVAFSVAATDGAEMAGSTVYPVEAPQRECLVRFGEERPFGNFGVYRIWFTDGTDREWRRRLKLHNGDLDCTFVYGNHRVVYNAGTLYSGSPFVSPSYDGPTGNLCGYVLHMPKDDRVLGATDFVLDWPIRDGTLQLEQVAFWMAQQMGLPYLRRRNIQLFVDGRKRGRIYEDIQQPNSDVIDQFHSHQQRGDLYKVEDWFEFTPQASREFNVDANLMNFINFNGEKHLPRYRYNWRKRAVQGSAHDYSSLFELVDAVNLPTSEAYTRAVESLIDVDEWMGIFAVEHIVGNWDAYGYRRGKNMYAYKPADGKWQLHMWDIDFVLGAGSDPPQTSMFSTIEPVIEKMFSHPPFNRAYFQAMQKAVDGPLQASVSTPVLEANRTALLENGIRAGSIRGGQRYIAQRLEFLQNEIAAEDARFEITTNNGEAFSSDRNFVTVMGTAPIRVHSIAMNGVRYPIRWLSTNTWQMDVPLSATTNALVFRGLDDAGEFVRESEDRLTIDFQGTLDSPKDYLVINEIMYLPMTEGAEFVEIHNTSLHTAFPLVNYRLDGVGFDFPQSSVIEPGAHVVLAADLGVYSSAYRGSGDIAGEYSGRLNPEGETLKLIFADPQSNQEVVIDKVTFGTEAPWPGLANGGGSSLQLIDPRRDNDRAGNWRAVGLEGPAQGWKFATVTGIATSSRLLIYLSANPPVQEFEGILGEWTGYVEFETDRSDIAFRFETKADGGIVPILVNGEQEFPFDAVEIEGQSVNILLNSEGIEVRMEGMLSDDGISIEGNLIQTAPDGGRFGGVFALHRDFPGGSVYLDDVVVVAGEIPERGENLVRNGSFESDLEGIWQIAANHANSSVVDAFQHTGQRSLFVTAEVGGFDAASAISQDIEGLRVGAQYTLSFRYLEGAGGKGLTVALEGFGLSSTVDIQPPVIETTQYTPGFQNSSFASLPRFPTIRINELQVMNPGGFLDRIGEADPWVELYNHGVEPINLSGFHLSPDYDNLTLWDFPDGAVIAPGGHQIVWLDDESAENSADEWHAGFRLDTDGGSLALSVSVGGLAILVDHVNYPQISGSQSFGLLPDGQAQSHQLFPVSTPGLVNVHDTTEVRLFINEWMAQNTATIADPADPTGMEFDDWFELYNAGSESVDLTGFFLSDNVDNPSKFEIPAGYLVAPGGFLLIWADGQPEQNGRSSDLHVNFRLSRGGGESIGLYSPNGTVIDLIQFGQQSADVSEGRKLDGSEGPFGVLSNPSPGGANGSSLLVVTEFELSADGQFRITFITQPGVRYQVRFTDTLDGLKWENLGEVVVADGESATVSDSFALQEDQRFYSVLRLE